MFVFWGYNFLKDISFKGQPVVPSILKEGRNITEGMFFDVEKLPGTNLDKLSKRADIPVIRKMEILKHVVGQLKEIDRAGLVLFDRAGRNTMVVSWGNGKGIATRQIDLEEFYDKTTQTVYSERTLDVYEEYVEEKQSLGLDLWTEAVDLLSNNAIDTLKDHSVPKSVLSIIMKYDDFSYLSSKKNVSAGILNVFEQDLDLTIQKLSRVKTPQFAILNPV